MPLTSHYRDRYRGKKSPPGSYFIYYVTHTENGKRETLGAAEYETEKSRKKHHSENYGKPILVVGNNISSINVYSYSLFSLK